MEVPTNSENIYVIPLFSLTPNQPKDDPPLGDTPPLKEKYIDVDGQLISSLYF